MSGASGDHNSTCSGVPSKAAVISWRLPGMPVDVAAFAGGARRVLTQNATGFGVGEGVTTAAEESVRSPMAALLR